MTGEPWYLRRCVECGRFVGSENYVVYTPYGGPSRSEPPDDEYLCLRCWDSKTEASRRALWGMVWATPVIVRDDVETVYKPRS